MFNLGFSEIIIIGVLALILIGPKQLPEVAKVVGRLMKEFKQATKDLSGGLMEVKEELRKPVQESLDALHNLQNDVQNEFYKQRGMIIEEVEDLAKKTTEMPETKTASANDPDKKTES